MARSGVRVRHPIFARFCVRVSHKTMARGAAAFRRELVADLSGRVIEVGAGHGINFPFYPKTVTELVAVEPEPYLRALARKAALEAQLPVRVVDGVAERLDADTGSFDAGVVSLVLCSVVDQDRALAELHRVIRPGGELRFYEHVRATTAGLARLQRIADALFWPTIGGGCHASRETRSAIERAGFAIERIREFAFRPAPALFLVAPHILGVARRRE